MPDIKLTLSSIKAAWADLRGGLARRALWLSLGWLEIKQRYRRSIIGPFWLTLGLAIFVIGLGVVFSSLFKMNLSEYMPHLAVGFIVWTFISTVIVEGCTVFIVSEGVIKQIQGNISVHVYRLVWRNALIFAHNFLVYVAVMLYFGINPGVVALLALPAFLLVCAAGFGIAMIVGIVSARFRDIPPIVMNLVQILFFVTPIVWKPESIASRPYIVENNPFFYMIEVVRAPLLGVLPPLEHWIAASAFTGAILLLAYLLFVPYRSRIAYWL